MSDAKQPVNVGIIGQGRSGWGIHADMIRKLPERFAVTAIYDEIPERLEQSADELGCRAATDIDDLINDANVELVVVSTFNHLHAPHALRALAAGKHVLCEKPFGLTVADVDEMIAAARDAGRIVAPFQQRRHEEDFQKVKEVIDSGVLGEVHTIRIGWYGFKRRWDWQTTRDYAGGALNNNGPHPLDHAVTLFGDADPDVWAEARRCLCTGDAEDHLRFILSGDGHPTVEVDLSDVWACGQDRWVVAGTRGGLKGNSKKLEWQWVDFEAMPARPLSMEPTPDRSYNREDIDWQTETWAPVGSGDVGGAGAAPPPGCVEIFYKDLYKTLREDVPLMITAEDVRMRVAVMEKIRAAAGIPVMA